MGITASPIPPRAFNPVPQRVKPSCPRVHPFCPALCVHLVCPEAEECGLLFLPIVLGTMALLPQFSVPIAYGDTERRCRPHRKGRTWGQNPPKDKTGLPSPNLPMPRCPQTALSPSATICPYCPSVPSTLVLHRGSAGGGTWGHCGEPCVGSLLGPKSAVPPGSGHGALVPVTH